VLFCGKVLVARNGKEVVTRTNDLAGFLEPQIKLSNLVEEKNDA
jgi:hypothetical protein